MNFNLGSLNKRNIIILTILAMILIWFCAYFFFPCLEFQLFTWYYSPIYQFFPDSLYTSFYLECGVSFALFLVFFLFIILSICFSKSKDKQKSRLSLWFYCVIIFFISLFYNYSLIQDILYLRNNNYEVAECSLSELTKSKRKGGYSYKLFIKDSDNEKYLKPLFMDCYQYVELNSLKKEFESDNIDNHSVNLKVYYLPNTGCLIKYQLISSQF